MLLHLEEHERPAEPTPGIELASAWSRVAPRLEGWLRSRGVDAHTAEDAVQETAARALASGPGFPTEADLLRWGRTVSWRVCIDLHRAGERLTVGPVPDRAGGVDVGDAVAHRAELSAVARQLAALSVDDREVLLDTLVAPEGAGHDRAEANRRKVRRHRARARLLAALGGVAATVAAVGRWAREVVPAHPTVATAMGAPVLVAGLVLPGDAPPVAHPPPPVAEESAAPGAVPAGPAARTGHPAAGATVAAPEVVPVPDAVSDPAATAGTADADPVAEPRERRGIVPGPAPCGDAGMACRDLRVDDVVPEPPPPATVVNLPGLGELAGG